jgi:hypothetical protein
MVYSSGQMAASNLSCSEKLAFDTEKEAKAAANFAKWSYGTKLKTYICKHCGLWHLSSSDS